MKRVAVEGYALAGIGVAMLDKRGIVRLQNEGYLAERRKKKKEKKTFKKKETFLISLR